MPSSRASPSAAPHQFDLSRPPREPRGGIRLDTVVPAAVVLHLFNVHFGLKIRERAHQVAALVREQVLHHDLSGPRVVIGDLNEWFPGAVGRTLRRELHGPRIRRTHPAPLPIFALDRIYWDRALHAEASTCTGVASPASRPITCPWSRASAWPRRARSHETAVVPGGS